MGNRFIIDRDTSTVRILSSNSEIAALENSIVYLTSENSQVKEIFSPLPRSRNINSFYDNIQFC